MIRRSFKGLLYLCLIYASIPLYQYLNLNDRFTVGPIGRDVSFDFWGFGVAGSSHGATDFYRPIKAGWI